MCHFQFMNCSREIKLQATHVVRVQAKREALFNPLQSTACEAPQRTGSASNARRDALSRYRQAVPPRDFLLLNDVRNIASTINHCGATQPCLPMTIGTEFSVGLSFHVVVLSNRQERTPKMTTETLEDAAARLLRRLDEKARRRETGATLDISRTSQLDKPPPLLSREALIPANLKGANDNRLIGAPPLVKRAPRRE